MLGIIFPIFSFAEVPLFKSEIAQPGGKLPQGAGITRVDQLLGILADVLKYVYTIFFIVAVAFIISTAFNYLTAHDNPEKIASAHKQLMWAAVAIVVALLSLSFTVIISQFIGGGSAGGGGGTGGSPVSGYSNTGGMNDLPGNTPFWNPDYIPNY